MKTAEEARQEMRDITANEMRFDVFVGYIKNWTLSEKIKLLFSIWF